MNKWEAVISHIICAKQIWRQLHVFCYKIYDKMNNPHCVFKPLTPSIWQYTTSHKHGTTILFDPPYLFLWIKWHCRPGHGGEIFLETGLIFVPADKHYLQIVATFFPVFIKIDQQRGKVPARRTPVCREIKAHHAPRPTERPHGHLLQAVPGLTEYMGPQ